MTLRANVLSFVKWTVKNCSCIFVGIDAFLILAHKNRVRGISLNPKIKEDQFIPVLRQENVIDVDYDAETNHIYWSDVSADTISRIFLNGSGLEVIVSEGESQFHLLVFFTT